MMEQRNPVFNQVDKVLSNLTPEECDMIDDTLIRMNSKKLNEVLDEMNMPRHLFMSRDIQDIRFADMPKGAQQRIVLWFIANHKIKTTFITTY